VTLVLLAKGPLLGFIVWYIYPWIDPQTNLKVIGLFSARINGLISGAALGYRIASDPGALIGAIGFYLLSRWYGPLVSHSIDGLVQKVYPLDFSIQTEKPEASSHKKHLLAMYTVVLPFLFLLGGVLMNIFQIPVAFPFPESRRNGVQGVVLFYAAFGAVTPWLLRRRLLARPLEETESPMQRTYSTYQLLGVAFLSLPMISGFILLIFGFPFIETILLTLLSSSLAFLWIQRTPFGS
jgi:hypothetical protein